MSKVCKLLGIKHPIIQGGMARVSEAGLAAAVSNGGGLGVIGAGAMSADHLREEIRKARSLTDKPFGVNLIANSHSSHLSKRVDVVLTEKPAAVTLGAIDRVDIISSFKEAGIRVLTVVSTVAMAKRCVQYGADAIIAEGTEAGGHIGTTTTMVLIPLLYDALYPVDVDVEYAPLIAAGGIATGHQMAAALMLGAEGVQIGTRFVCATECNVHPAVKEKFIKARDRATVVTGKVPIRSIKNRLTDNYAEISAGIADGKIDPGELESFEYGKLELAMQDGNVREGYLMAGQCVALIHKEQRAAEIIKEIIDRCKGQIGYIDSRVNNH